MRVLVVDDEADLADAVGRGLRREGYAVDVVYGGREALDRISYTEYDLVCLDLTMPDIDGLAVCRAIRSERGAAVRVLMLTARDSIQDRVTGLDYGADDYLVKPFAFPELAARIRMLLRRDSTHNDSVLQVGEVRLDTSRHEAWRGERKLDLTAKEFALLRLFRDQRRRSAFPGAVARTRLGRARGPLHQHGACYRGNVASQALHRRRGSGSRDRRRRWLSAVVVMTGAR